MRLDLDAWTEQQKLHIDRARVDLTHLIYVLRNFATDGQWDPAAFRKTLTRFEDVEMDISGDLELLEPFYMAFDTEEYGWSEASDEELLAAARKAFGLNLPGGPVEDLGELHRALHGGGS